MVGRAAPGLTSPLPTVRGGAAGPASGPPGPPPALVPRLRPSRAAAGRGHRRRHHHASQHLPALGPREGERREGEGETPAPFSLAHASCEPGAPLHRLPPS